MNCEWAAALTRFDCRPMRTHSGDACLEIGTPFSIPGGHAINLYLVEEGSHIRISDNADTIMAMDAIGIDVSSRRIGSFRDAAKRCNLTVTDSGEVMMLTRPEHAAAGFANAVSGMIMLSHWAAEQLRQEPKEHDLASELEPYIIARNPTATLTRHPKVMGASRAIHTFDLQHGKDLIDVISAHSNSTGSAMRKCGDIINGPFANGATPLIIVDDRKDRETAEREIGILASVTRAMAVSRLIGNVLH